MRVAIGWCQYGPPAELPSIFQGALDLIAQAGGGVVEAYPQDTAGKKISATTACTPHTPDDGLTASQNPGYSARIARRRRVR